MEIPYSEALGWAIAISCTLTGIVYKLFKKTVEQSIEINNFKVKQELEEEVETKMNIVNSKIENLTLQIESIKNHSTYNNSSQSELLVKLIKGIEKSNPRILEDIID